MIAPTVLAPGGRGSRPPATNPSNRFASRRAVSGVHGAPWGPMVTKRCRPRAVLNNVGRRPQLAPTPKPPHRGIPNDLSGLKRLNCLDRDRHVIAPTSYPLSYHNGAYGRKSQTDRRRQKSLILLGKVGLWRAVRNCGVPRHQLIRMRPARHRLDAVEPGADVFVLRGNVKAELVGRVISLDSPDDS